MPSSRANGSSRLARGDLAEATGVSSPRSADRARSAGREMLSSLRKAHSDSAPLESSSRNLEPSRLPFGRRLRHVLRRMDRTGPHAGGAARARALDRTPFVGPCVGPETRHASRRRARAGGGAPPHNDPTGSRSTGRLLEGLSVPSPRRGRTTLVCLFPSDACRAGVFCSLTGRQDLGMPRVCPTTNALGRREAPSAQRPTS